MIRLLKTVKNSSDILSHNTRIKFQSNRTDSSESSLASIRGKQYFGYDRS